MDGYRVRRWILDRLGEVSTWKGVSILAGLFGLVVAPDQLEIIGAAIVSIVGAIEMIRKEA